MTNDSHWHTEFAKIISCKKCTAATCRHLLRDDHENVPQPGYIGNNYWETRVLLVGQNPGTPKSRESEDVPYTEALRALRDEPTPEHYEGLRNVLRDFIPKWPVTNRYFPLSDCDLTLEDIAYCNVIRCRTISDKKPNSLLAENCVEVHFTHWLHLLKPKVVVFIGKQAWEHGHKAVMEIGVPFEYMNRNRSLSSDKRKENRTAVIQLVRKHRN